MKDTHVHISLVAHKTAKAVARKAKISLKQFGSFAISQTAATYVKGVAARKGTKRK